MIDCLPSDWRNGTFLGRILTEDGPTPVLVVEGRLRDVSTAAPTTSEFLSGWSGTLPAGRDLGPIEATEFKRAWEGAGRWKLLAPVDLQCIKACGVTFAVSAVERVIEERARGEASKAEAIRAALRDRVGADIRSVKPGSAEAKKLKEALIADGLWSQYLEVAIGPDAEVFTKAPCLSSVGWGDFIGVRSDSVWNNPEPEIVIVTDRTGRALGASLGNDVNLRCIEGRSALLLGKAKDNNASCAIGPFVRLFDTSFSMDDVREATVRLEVDGEDGFKLKGSSSMSLISRDPLELVGQTIGKHHQYPDGIALFLGTMFAPTENRDAKGQGFTHHMGDLVRVSSEKLGVLENKVTRCDAAPAWGFGLGDLMANLAARGLLRPKELRH
jgi:fumarylacetoacetate (FAA) hydrolase family protein